MADNPYATPSATLHAKGVSEPRDLNSLGRKIFGFSIGGILAFLALMLLAPNTDGPVPDPLLSRLARIILLFGPPIGLSILTGHLLGSTVSRGYKRLLLSAVLLGLVMGMLTDGALYGLVYFTEQKPMPNRDFLEGLGWLGGIFVLANCALGSVLYLLSRKRSSPE